MTKTKTIATKVVTGAKLQEMLHEHLRNVPDHKSPRVYLDVLDAYGNPILTPLVCVSIAADGSIRLRGQS